MLGRKCGEDSRQYIDVCFLVGGPTSRASGWFVGKAQVASHEPTIVQIITSLCGGLHCGGIVSAVATTLPL